MSETLTPTLDMTGNTLAGLPRSTVESMVRAEAEGEADDTTLALLNGDPARWASMLLDLIEDTEDALDNIKTIKGAHRNMVIADFRDELAQLEASYVQLTGEDLEPLPTAPVAKHAATNAKEPDFPPLEAGNAQLHLSWSGGRIIAWAAAEGILPDDHEALIARLEAVGAPTGVWIEHAAVQLPRETTAAAVEAPVGQVLGWLVAIGAADDALNLGDSSKWLSHIAVIAVDLVGQGRFVPRLHRNRRRRNKRNTKNERAEYRVEWVPGIISQDKIKALAASIPGAVTAVDPGPDARAVVQGTLTGMVDAIVSMAASMLEVPAPPPDPRTKAEVAEMVLAHLSGNPFEVPADHAGEVARRLEQWARPATAVAKYQLIAQLDPPDSAGAWHLKVLAPGPENTIDPVEVAIGTGSNTRRAEVKDQLARMERLLPALLRPGGRRRGEVVLSQDEAWDLMSETGPALEAAGFEVRVPPLSRKKPSAALRLTAEESTASVVGAQQLTAVRWSAVFDGIELDAMEIARLALQARPLVQSHGRWVALDHADLAEAAAALAERADNTHLTGAEMLRHALGLEGTPVSGGVSIGGDGWAADLLRSASDIPEISTSPKGFEGELRSYQAEAVSWLGFLDAAGLGGCLALDMGLGKTPTVLAHTAATAGNGCSLVIAPPAVVGNWANEARKFSPSLKVLVHHGPNRAGAGEIERATAGRDLVITTYGTAVRDMDLLADMTWNRVVLDEAQIIKNPTSETARELRRLQARTRLALTGTPIENGLGDLWAILDFLNPGLVGPRAPFIAQLSKPGDSKGAAESALHALNGVLVFRRTKSEPAIAAELPDRIDELAHCSMTPEQIGLYQAVLDDLVRDQAENIGPERKGQVLAAITALKQICNHPAAYRDDDDDRPLDGRSGKLMRVNEIVDNVFAAGERVLIFTHFAQWGDKLATYLTDRTGVKIECYHGGLGRGARDRMVEEFQAGKGAGAMVLSLKAGGTGLNLTAASHVVLYDRWWNPAVEDQARDRVWRIGQTKTVICHRLVCPGTVDERVEEVVQGKRRIADMVLPKSSSIGDLDARQLGAALGLDPAMVLTDDDEKAAADLAQVPLELAEASA
ncbi:MAG: superfamily II DNA or RNA helicase [Candidatus Poriferisodalaceae bacterium]|jgi:superfamily II DNA or RNA helicase